MIDFSLTEEQQMLRDVVARFVRDNCGLRSYREDAASELGFRQSRWQDFARLGWLGLSIEEELGGLACGFLEVAIVMEEFGRGLVLEPFLSTAVLCSHLLRNADQPARRKELLRPLIAGNMLSALAHDEPGGGFTSGPVLQTVATREADGYRLNGTKMMALGAPTAQQLVVSARMADDERGRFALVLLDPRAAGVAMTHYPLIDFTRASDVRLEQVRVGADAILVGVERAHQVLEEAIDLATLACVAEALGCMETILQLTVDHLKTREQFGKPLGRNQALAHRVAEMFIEVEETRSILFQGITRLDQGAARRRAAVSAAKVYASGAGQLVGEQGVQLHGGIGVTVEAQVGHYYKKLVMLDKLFGDADHHLQRFASERGYC